MFNNLTSKRIEGANHDITSTLLAEVNEFMLNLFAIKFRLAST